LAGVHDPKKAAQVIGQTAQLELYDLEGDLVAPSIDSSFNPVATPSLYSLLLPVQGRAKEGTPSHYYLFDKKKEIVADAATKQGVFIGRESKLRPGEKLLMVPAGEVIVTCGGPDSIQAKTKPQGPCPGGGNPTVVNYYLFKHTPELTGKDLNGGGVKQDFDTSGNPIVRLSFTSKGDHKVQQVTKQLYIPGGLRPSPPHLAIVPGGPNETHPH